jgi:hypothetical protein
MVSSRGTAEAENLLLLYYTRTRAMTREEFIEYVKDTLIPDLKASGSYSSAQDWKAALLFLDGYHEVEFKGESFAFPVGERESKGIEIPMETLRSWVSGK